MNFLPRDTVDSFPAEARAETQLAQKLKDWYHPELYDQYQRFDQLVDAVSAEADTAAMLEKAAWILRRRFVHAYSVYDVQDNWIAALCGRFIWRDLAARVIPDDILKSRAAACSQVSIVFIELCRKIGISARRVSLNGHFACEARWAGQWHYFDLDLKPDFQRIGGRKSIREILDANLEHRLYAGTIVDSLDVRRIFSSVSYGAEDEWLAPRAEIFHRISGFLSRWLWIFLFLLAGLIDVRMYRG